MLELAVVLAALMGLAIGGLLSSVPAGSLITLGGIATLALGLVLAVPTGFWYHVALYRMVSARTALPRTWWLSPSAFHRHLTEDEYRRLSRWYRTGGVGFVLCLVGGLAAIASLLLQR